MAIKYLAIDYGERRVGLAVGDDAVRLASPYVTLENGAKLAESLHQIIAKEQIDGIVIGLPRGLDGQDTRQTQAVRDWAKGQKFGRPVQWIDEGMTSEQAKLALQASGKAYAKPDIDKEAAAVFLQDFLNSL